MFIRITISTMAFVTAAECQYKQNMRLLQLHLQISMASKPQNYNFDFQKCFLSKSLRLQISLLSRRNDWDITEIKEWFSIANPPEHFHCTLMERKAELMQYWSIAGSSRSSFYIYLFVSSPHPPHGVTVAALYSSRPPNLHTGNKVTAQEMSLPKHPLSLSLSRIPSLVLTHTPPAYCHDNREKNRI